MLPHKTKSSGVMSLELFDLEAPMLSWVSGFSPTSCSALDLDGFIIWVQIVTRKFTGTLASYQTRLDSTNKESVHSNVLISWTCPNSTNHHDWGKRTVLRILSISHGCTWKPKHGLRMDRRLFLKGKLRIWYLENVNNNNINNKPNILLVFCVLLYARN